MRHLQRFLYNEYVCSGKMSTSPASAADSITESLDETATPVSIDVDDLESTSPEYLRDLKYDLSKEDYVVARLNVEASFDENCSLETNREVERLRKYVRAAAFLGASRLTVEVDAVCNPEKVEPALEAAEERARREGVSLDIRT
jgi:hypothetical protein